MTDPRLPVSEEEVEAIVIEAVACDFLYHPGRLEFRGQAFRLATAAHAVLVPRIERALEIAGRRAFSCSFEGGEYEIHAKHVAAAFWRAMEEA